jgi:hypothetical protein
MSSKYQVASSKEKQFSSFAAGMLLAANYYLLKREVS